MPSFCDVAHCCVFVGPDGNDLTGAIPSELDRLTSLEELDLCKYIIKRNNRVWA
jgi:hypothetical protein